MFVNKNAEEKCLLPKLIPHEDKCYLLAFHSDNCDHCDQMEPVLKRLEKDLKTKIRRINVSKKNEFYGLFELVGGNEGGSFPFYYNRRTAQAVSGATTYANLKRWGTGSTKHLFSCPPESLQTSQDYDPNNRRDVGLYGFFKEKVMRMEKAGKKKAEKETKK